MKTWLLERARHLEKLGKALEKGLVDEGVIPILEAVNRCSSYVTKSSCYGRIHITQEESLIKKGRGKTLLKIHGPISLDKVEEALEKARGGVVWMNVEGTILHIAAEDLGKAVELLGIAIEAGYRYSSIYSIGGRGVTVEILLAPKYSIPLRAWGEDILGKEEIQEALRYAERLFGEAEKARHRFLTILGELGCE